MHKWCVRTSKEPDYLDMAELAANAGKSSSRTAESRNIGSSIYGNRRGEGRGTLLEANSHNLRAVFSKQQASIMELCATSLGSQRHPSTNL